MPDEKNETQLDNESLRILAELVGKRSAGSKVYLVGTIMGISVGAIFCIAGFIIAIMGLSGSIEWIIEAEGVKSRLTNATPGVFFALLGVIVLWRYKPKTEDELKFGPAYHHGAEVVSKHGAKVLSKIEVIHKRSE